MTKIYSALDYNFTWESDDVSFSVVLDPDLVMRKSYREAVCNGHRFIRYQNSVF